MLLCEVLNEEQLDEGKLKNAMRAAILTTAALLPNENIPHNQEDIKRQTQIIQQNASTPKGRTTELTKYRQAKNKAKKLFKMFHSNFPNNATQNEAVKQALWLLDLHDDQPITDALWEAYLGMVRSLSEDTLSELGHLLPQLTDVITYITQYELIVLRKMASEPIGNSGAAVSKEQLRKTIQQASDYSVFN